LATVLWPDGSGYLNSWPLLAAIACGTAIAVIAGMRVKPNGNSELAPADVADDPGRRWAPIFLAMLVPLLFALWWNAIGEVRGFDSLSDHLPRAARWLRLGRLSDESGQLLTPYYPGDFQLLLRWMLVLGTDAYAFVPALLAGALALGA